MNPLLKVVVNDIRFIHEYNSIKELGGYIIKVYRDIPDKDNHLSESELDNFTTDKFNHIILNDKTKDHLYKYMIDLIN